MTEAQIKAYPHGFSKDVIRLNEGNNGHSLALNTSNTIFEKMQRDQARVAALVTRVKEQIKQDTTISKNGRRKVAIGGKTYSFRSHWEVNYAYYLEFLKSQGDITAWEYEPQIFWFEGIKRGTTNYTPDFKVTYPNGKHDWREVKGWLDPKSKTKLKRMLKYHPLEIVRLIDSAWFKRNGGNLSLIVPGWTKKK